MRSIVGGFWRANYQWRAYRKRTAEPELALLPALVDRQRAALDVGANRALYTIPLRALAACVHSFEAVPYLALRLRAAYPDVHVHDIAVSDRESMVSLRLPGRNTSWATIEAANELEKARGAIREIEVRSRPLDALDLGPVGFIKIDVEGHELAVLHGAQQLLAREQPTLLIELEERHSPGAISSAQSCLAKLGYAGYFLDGTRLRPMTEFECERDQNRQHVSERGKIGRYLNNFMFIPAARLASPAAILRGLGLDLPACMRRVA